MIHKKGPSETIAGYTRREQREATIIRITPRLRNDTMYFSCASYPTQFNGNAAMLNR